MAAEYLAGDDAVFGGMLGGLAAGIPLGICGNLQRISSQAHFDHVLLHASKANASPSTRQSHAGTIIFKFLAGFYYEVLDHVVGAACGACGGVASATGAAIGTIGGSLVAIAMGFFTGVMCGGVGLICWLRG